MKKLSVPTLAVAIIGSLAAPACSEKIKEINEDTNSAVASTTVAKETTAKSFRIEFERCIKFSHRADQNGWRAACNYDNAGDRTKARELWLEYAKKAEQNGCLNQAAIGYSGARDRTKARELWLEYAQQAEEAEWFDFAARAYYDAGDEAKADEMWLEYAKQAEQNGWFEDAARAYDNAGYKAKAEEWRKKLKAAEEWRKMLNL